MMASSSQWFDDGRRALLVALFASGCLGDVDPAGKQCGPGGHCPAGLRCSVKNTCERDAEGIASPGGSGTGGSGTGGSGALGVGGVSAGAGGSVSSPRGDGSNAAHGGASSIGDVAGTGGAESPAPLGPDAGGNSAAPDAAVETPSLLTIAGHVIDRLRRPVPGVAVTVGETTLATDEAGAFHFDGVPSPYDVALLLEPPDEQPKAWVYQGLTRTDPTLQVLSAFTERSSGYFSVASNVVLTATQELGLGAAGPDGTFESASAYGTFWTWFEWRGAARASAMFHGLLWENSAAGLPIGYLAYDSKPMTFDENVDAEITLDLSPDELVHTSVSGSVTGGTDTYRHNYAYLYFADQSQIELVYQAEAPNTFEFVVPSLPDASIVVAASDGYGVAHQQVAPGTANIALTIPSPARPLAPDTDVVGVGPGSVFEWEGDADVHVLYIEDYTVTARTLRVVTANKSVVLPALPNFSLNPGRRHYWEVQTHGNPRTVDELAGPDGFIDPFYYPLRGVGGPRRIQGSTSSSNIRWFTSR